MKENIFILLRVFKHSSLSCFDGKERRVTLPLYEGGTTDAIIENIMVSKIAKIISVAKLFLFFSFSTNLRQMEYLPSVVSSALLCGICPRILPCIPLFREEETFAHSAVLSISDFGIYNSP